MTKPISTAIGRVVSVSPGESKTGKRFAALRLELAPSTWNGKTYSMKIEARAYRDAESLLHTPAGTWVCATGDASTEAYLYQQKPCARLVITGTVTVLPSFGAPPIGAAFSATPSSDQPRTARPWEMPPPAAASPPSASMATTPSTASSAGEDPDSDDVPF